jgi:hypothetical protein
VSAEVEILSYLAQYPEAKDTPEGIAEWWMSGPHGIRPTATEIKAALENLCARGLVVAEQGADCIVYYRAIDDKKSETRNNSSNNRKPNRNRNK